MLDDVLYTSAKSREWLMKAYEALSKTVELLEADYELDVVLLEFRQAINHVGRLLGEELSDKLLESIFSRFCVGK